MDNHTKQLGPAIRSKLRIVTGLQAGAVVLVVASLAVFGFWVSRNHVGNIERLSAGFESLVEGEYGTSGGLAGSGEWNQLERGFNDLSETLAHRQTEVRVLNRVLRHNLRNAMTVVVGNADRIITKVDDEQATSEARQIRRRGESLLDLAEHARTIECSMGDHGESDTVLRAGPVVEGVVTVLEDEFPNAPFETDGGDDGAWVPGGDLLVNVLDELGRNAVVHSDTDHPHVEFIVGCDPDTVRFTVADDGPGLPPLERRVLTDPFVGTPTEHGMGLGLWLVTWLVGRIDGEIHVAVGDETKITVSPPRADPPPEGDSSTPLTPLDSRTEDAGRDETDDGRGARKEDPSR